MQINDGTLAVVTMVTEATEAGRRR